MKATIIPGPLAHATCEPSRAARERMLSKLGEPLFIAGWRRVLMIHFEVDPKTLQRHVPFPLDLWAGRAFISLVAFTMHDMRPRFGGEWTARLFRPLATHEFLNVRTYVRCGPEPGIHFMAEWLPNWLASKLGPTIFGLPYHYGHLAYDHNETTGLFQGQVVDATSGAKLSYRARATSPPTFQPSPAGSHTEWLMERYTAFNAAGFGQRFFRVWHPPWEQCAVDVTLTDLTLLTQRWPWFRTARLHGANYAPGWDEVWMGRPHFCK